MSNKLPPAKELIDAVYPVYKIKHANLPPGWTMMRITATHDEVEIALWTSEGDYVSNHWDWDWEDLVATKGGE